MCPFNPMKADRPAMDVSRHLFEISIDRTFGAPPMEPPGKQAQARFRSGTARTEPLINALIRGRGPAWLIRVYMLNLARDRPSCSLKSCLTSERSLDYCDRGWLIAGFVPLLPIRGGASTEIANGAGDRLQMFGIAACASLNRSILTEAVTGSADPKKGKGCLEIQETRAVSAPTTRGTVRVAYRPPDGVPPGPPNGVPPGPVDPPVPPPRRVGCDSADK